MIKVLYVGMYYDYGIPWQGLSHEENNFHAGLKSHPDVEATHFDFMELFRVFGKDAMNAKLLNKIEENDYDLLFFVPFTNEFYEETFDKLLDQKIITIAWGCDDHWRFDDFSSHWAPHFNYWVTTASSSIPKFHAMGYKNVIKSQWAGAPSVYKNMKLEKDIPISFMGQPHGNRAHIMQEVYNAGIQIQLFGLGWYENSRVTQAKMIEIFNRSKINLNLSNSSGMQPESQIKGRIFEVPCCGGFLLTDMSNDLDAFFEIGKELVVYDGKQDMIDKIKYYIDHNSEREKIAKAGYDRVLKEHTWKHRFDEIFKAAGFGDKLDTELKMKTSKHENKSIDHFAKPSKKKLKILHTVNNYYPHLGAAERMVQQISEGLSIRGHDVTVATVFDPHRDSIEINGVRIAQFKTFGSLAGKVEGEVNEYMHFILAQDWDVIMNYAAQIWSTDLIFPIIDRLNCVKVFVPCGYSGLHIESYRDYYQKLPGVLPLYDAVIHLSQNYSDTEYSRQHGFRNSVIIPSGVDESEFSKASLGIRSKYGIKTKYLLLAVSNHYFEKGHDRVIQAFERLNNVDTTLLIIGNNDGDSTCFNHCTQRAELNDRILLATDMPRDDIVSAYKEADIFIHGSHVECFPLVILEAMASRTPYVSTNVGNVSELAGGIVCDPENMADVLAELIKNTKMREDLAKEGFDDWQRNYKLSTIIDTYENLYLNLVEKNKANLNKSS